MLVLCAVATLSLSLRDSNGSGAEVVSSSTPAPGRRLASTLPSESEMQREYYNNRSLANTTKTPPSFLIDVDRRNWEEWTFEPNLYKVPQFDDYLGKWWFGQPQALLDIRSKVDQTLYESLGSRDFYSFLPSKSGKIDSLSGYHWRIAISEPGFIDQKDRLIKTVAKNSGITQAAITVSFPPKE